MKEIEGKSILLSVSVGTSYLESTVPPLAEKIKGFPILKAKSFRNTATYISKTLVSWCGVRL